MATITIDPTAIIGIIDPGVFGSFVEHLGRCVYGGIYEPDSPRADADGFRLDVLAAVRHLAPTTIRYPGGGVVNRHPDAPIETELRFVGAWPPAVRTAETVTGPDVSARNSFEQPNLVSVARSAWSVDTGHSPYTFPAHSLTMLTVPL